MAFTSNPEGASVQHACDEGGTSVADHVVSQLADFNGQCDQQHLGPVGIVVGAMVDDAVECLGIDLPSLSGVFLAPELGVQGADPARVREVFTGAENIVLASSSRTILRAGPSIAGLRDAYHATVDLLQ